MAKCHQTVGNTRCALILWESISNYSCFKDSDSDSNSFKLQALEGIAECHKTLGDIDSAEQAYTRVFTIRRRVLGDNHSDTIGIAESLLDVKLDIIKVKYNSSFETLKSLASSEFEALVDLFFIVTGKKLILSDSDKKTDGRWGWFSKIVSKITSNSKKLWKN
ncbi:MAG: tetratricopeptide repeat protein [Methylococcales bacterium]